MERWRGRVALVTGASEGIGAAIVKWMVGSGMKVVGVARKEHKIQELAAELIDAPGELHAVHADVSKEEDVLAAMAYAKNTLGGVDVLVNNAGLSPFFHLVDGKTDAFSSLLNVNILGLCMFTREVVSNMRERGVDDGHIIHISSISGQGLLDEPGYYAYASTKHAVRVLTEGLRRELRDLKTKIRVTSISPGFVRTNILMNGGLSEEENAKMFDENPVLEPEDIAGAVEYALSAPAHVQIHEITIKPVGEIY